MSLLILSHLGDVHASAVAGARQRVGLRTEIFCFDDFPVNSTISYDLESEAPFLRGPTADARLDEFRIVWNRRGWDPEFSPELDPRDRRLLAPICRRFCDEMRLTPPPGQIWVNSRLAQLLMRSKALQLRMARDLGFSLPRTLISNDPAKVRDFLSGPGHFIMKSLAPMHWTEDGRVISLPTTRVALADMDDDVTVQSCPMVYQELVEKEHELRVIVFGKRVLWVKIHSQAQGRYVDDWRHGMATELQVERVEAPPACSERSSTSAGKRTSIMRRSTWPSRATERRSSSR